MKKILGSGSGVTLIELLITSTIVSVLLVGTINLLSRVYRDIAASVMKNNSMTFASEKLDLFKKTSFTALSITGDQYLPMPYYKLKTAPRCYEKQNINGIDYEIYTWVQWAEEKDGVLDGRNYSELSSVYDYNMKKINVVVIYTANNTEKISKMSTYVTNKDLPIKGSIIEGRVLKNTGGVITGAGLSSGAYAMLQDFPQYMTRIIDDDGHFKILDVAPGTYTMFARGSGLVSTNYASNPLVISSVPTTYRDMNITCAAVPAGKVKGFVYWYTPEPTPSAVPTVVEQCNDVKTLYGTGAMSGKTQQWTNSTKISLFDGDFDGLCFPCTSDAYMPSDSQNTKLYSEFADATAIANSGICNVYIKFKTNTYLDYNKLGFNFTNDSGAHWANTGTNTWSGTVNDVFAQASVPNVLMDVELALDITSLYAEWTWQKVNSLGFVVKAYNFGDGNGRSTLDYVSIDVKYYVGEPTPTPKPTPAETPSYPCVYNAYVASLDNLSAPGRTSSNECTYEITGIDASTGFTSMIAFKERDSNGLSYYKRIDNVPVSTGSVTKQDIFLELTGDEPAIFGTVKNAATDAPVIGAKVMLNDYAETNTYTAGGGAFFMSPAAEGVYTLKAELSGYTTLNPITRKWDKGIAKADTLLLQPVGNISGNVTHEDGSPAEDVTVRVLDASGLMVKYGKTDASGYYMIEEVWSGPKYSMDLALDPDEIKTTFPDSGKYENIITNLGVTIPNKDFKVQEMYGSIKGKVQVDGVDLKSGTVVLAYPQSMPTPAHAQDFKMSDSDKNKRSHGGRGKVTSPYWGGMTDNSANFEILVPMGENYNLYAFYSFVSYTGKSSKPNKQLKNFYKIRTNVPPNSTGQDIAGELSTWNTY